MATASTPSWGLQTPPDSVSSSRRSSTASSRFTRIERRLSNGVVSTSCILNSDWSSPRRNSIRPSLLKTASLPISISVLSEQHDQHEISSVSPQRREILDEMRPRSPKTCTPSRSSICNSFDDADMVMKLETSLRSKSAEVAQLRQVIQELQMAVWSRSRDTQLEERTRIAEKKAASLSNTVDILNCKLNDAEAWSEQVKREYHRQFQLLEKQIAELKAAQFDQQALSGSGPSLDRASCSIDNETNLRSCFKYIQLLFKTGFHLSSALSESIAERNDLIGTLKLVYGRLEALERECDHSESLLLNNCLDFCSNIVPPLELCYQRTNQMVSKFSKTDCSADEQLPSTMSSTAGVVDMQGIWLQTRQPQCLTVSVQTDHLSIIEAASQAGHRTELNQSSVEILASLFPTSVSESSQPTLNSASYETFEALPVNITNSSQSMHIVNPVKSQHSLCDIGSQTDALEQTNHCTSCFPHSLLSPDKRPEIGINSTFFETISHNVKPPIESFPSDSLDHSEPESTTIILPNSQQAIAPASSYSSLVASLPPMPIEQSELKSDLELTAKPEVELKQMIEIESSPTSSFGPHETDGLEKPLSNANERLNRRYSTKTSSKSVEHRRAPSTPHSVSPLRTKSHGAHAKQPLMSASNHNRTKSLNRLLAIEHEFKQLQEQNSFLKNQFNIDSAPPIFTMNPIRPSLNSKSTERSVSEPPSTGSPLLFIETSERAGEFQGTDNFNSVPMCSSSKISLTEYEMRECNSKEPFLACEDKKNEVANSITELIDQGLYDGLNPCTESSAAHSLNLSTETSAMDASGLSFRPCANGPSAVALDQFQVSAVDFQQSSCKDIIEEETVSLMTLSENHENENENLSGEKLLLKYVSELSTINYSESSTMPLAQNLHSSSLEEFALKNPRSFSQLDKTTTLFDRSESDFDTFSQLASSESIDDDKISLSVPVPAPVMKGHTQPIILGPEKHNFQETPCILRSFSDGSLKDPNRQNLLVKRRQSLDPFVHSIPNAELHHVIEPRSYQASLNDTHVPQTISAIKKVAKYDDGVPKWRKLVRRRLDFILYTILALCLHIGIELGCIYSQYC